MENTCNACKGPYHESNGHILSEKTKLCGGCAKDFSKWVASHTRRRYKGVSFYDHAFPPPEKGAGD